MIQLWISEGAYFVDSLTEYYPIVFAIECGVVYKIWGSFWRHGFNLILTFVFMVFVRGSSPTGVQYLVYNWLEDVLWYNAIHVDKPFMDIITLLMDKN